MTYNGLSDEDEFRNQHSFGWDLAGYGNSYSALCDAVRRGNFIDATILDCDAVCRPRLGMTGDLRQLVRDECKIIELCCDRDHLVVDVPIDLSPLPELINPNATVDARYYWQLVKRPVDHALGALTPLADRIGYAVARLANLRRSLDPGCRVELDDTLFETYPAANLELLRQGRIEVRRVNDTYRWLGSLRARALVNWPLWLQESLSKHPRGDLGGRTREYVIDLLLQALTAHDPDIWAQTLRGRFEQDAQMLAQADKKPPYKGGFARFKEQRWVGSSRSCADCCLADLLNALSFCANTNEIYNADEFDAALCSLVDCLPEQCQMPHDALLHAIRGRLCEAADGIPNESLVPSGYRVLSNWSQEIRVKLHRQRFGTVGELHEYLKNI